MEKIWIQKRDNQNERVTDDYREPQETHWRNLHKGDNIYVRVEGYEFFKTFINCIQWSIERQTKGYMSRVLLCVCGGGGGVVEI